MCLCSCLPPHVWLVFATTRVLVFATTRVLAFATARVLVFATTRVLAFATARVLVFATTFRWWFRLCRMHVRALQRPPHEFRYDWNAG
jgi:hypothetical protein